MGKRSSYRYSIVDVFTQQPLEGNSLAVFSDAEGLSMEMMQKIARETNLSETSFVFPASRSDCAVNVRIFTPAKEMIFAGHPTIGTSFVLLHEGLVPRDSRRFMLEEKVGAVPIRVEAGDPPLIWLSTPTIHDGKMYDAAVCAEVLGLSPDDLMDIKPQLLSAGNPTLFVAVKDKARVDKCWLDLGGATTLKAGASEPFCVFVFAPTTEGAYSRMFAPEYGVVEDPATGSSTGPLAAFMMRHGLLSRAAGTRAISEQGTKMGRHSLLHIMIQGEGGADGIEVGGSVTPVASGVMTL